MAVVTQLKPPGLSVELFRAFYATRPDEERWQLIDGAAITMTPPTVAHQVIATNLQMLLTEAVRRHAPMLAAFQRLGVNVAPPVDDYDPEPDVAVIDADAGRDPERRYVDRFYLAAEIVSASDRAWSEKKREIYMLHQPCNCVLLVQQDRCEVSIDSRTSTGWTRQILTTPDAVIELAEFGLRCCVADLYRGTALQPRSAPTR